MTKNNNSDSRSQDLESSSSSSSSSASSPSSYSLYDIVNREITERKNRDLASKIPKSDIDPYSKENQKKFEELLKIINDRKIDDLFTSIDDYLKRNKSLLFMSTESGETLLHAAIRAKKEFTSRLIVLLNEIEEPKFLHLDIYNTNSTPLHLAIENGSERVATDLVKQTKVISDDKLAKSYPFDHDIQDKDGNTPLHLAAKYNNNLITEILLDRGADASIKNNEGQTAFDLAFNNSHFDICKTIVSFTYFDTEYFMNPRYENDACYRSIIDEVINDPNFHPRNKGSLSRRSEQTEFSVVSQDDKNIADILASKHSEKKISTTRHINVFDTESIESDDEEHKNKKDENKPATSIKESLAKVLNVGRFTKNT